MIKALLNGILNIAISVIDIVLIPINALVVNLFPNMASAITKFNSFVGMLTGNLLGYIFNFLPTGFKSLLVIYLTFIISYYGIIYTYKGIIKIYEVIQKLKFW